MANVPRRSTDTTNSNRSELVSILVSKLPTEFLLPDLRELLLGHFANFGRILRISCATKGGRDRIGHIQFASSEEARKAHQNGRTMNGHCMLINLTAKTPDTKILPCPPKPLRTSLVSSQNNPPVIMVNESKAKMQATLASYFQRQSGSKEEKDVPHVRTTVNSILDEAISSTSFSERKPNLINATTTALAGETSQSVDSKPQPCVKIEVYEGPSLSQCQLQGQGIRSMSSAIAVSTQNPIPQATLRPTKSLREILNIDTKNMKTVKTVTASDAVACQWFRGSQGPHPFPLSLMFGRIPGSVIMPVKAIMDSIKPGLEIQESTINTIWNTLLTSVLKSTLQKSAKAVFQEALVSKLAMEKYQELEEKIIHKEIVETAEREVGYEEDTMICCEEVLDAMLGLVCSSMIEDFSEAEFRRDQAISKVVTCCYRKLTKIVVTDLVETMVHSQVLECLCEEVIDDLMYSPIFELHVKVVAVEALKQRFVENSSSSSSNSKFADRSVHVSPELLPQIDRSKQISNWLQTSCDNIQVDSYESDESITTMDTDISCSQSSSQPCVSSEGDSTVPLIPPNMSVTSRPISKQSAVADAGTGLLASFKRKAKSLLGWNTWGAFKKPRREQDVKNDDD